MRIVKKTKNSFGKFLILISLSPCLIMKDSCRSNVSFIGLNETVVLFALVRGTYVRGPIMTKEREKKYEQKEDLCNVLLYSYLIWVPMVKMD